MDLSAVETLLQKLGCDKISRRRNGWVQSTCPFAPYTNTHKNRRDDHPSFGIGPRRRGGGASDDERNEAIWGFKCYTCNKHGLLKWLLNDLQDVSGRDLSPLHRYVQSDKTLPGIKIDRSSPLLPPVGDRNTRPAPVIDEQSLSRFQPMSLVPMKYLVGRGILPSTISKWGLMWDPSGLRVVLPIRDREGKLVGYSRRAIVDPEVSHLSDPGLPKFLHCTAFTPDLYLFGAHLMGDSRIAYVVEGFFDAMYLWQCGYVGSVAIMGSWLSRVQANSLINSVEEVVVIGDGDKAGRKMTNDSFVLLSKAVKCRMVYLPDGCDPDDLSESQLVKLLGFPGEKGLDNRTEAI